MKKIILLLFVLSFFSSGLLMAQAGSLDPGFSGDGKLVFDMIPSGSSVGYCVAVQSDGKIVIGGAGSSSSGSGTDITLARLKPDGSFDPTFGGGDGIVLTDFIYTYNRIHCIAIQPDGKIVASGVSGIFSPTTDVFATLRYNSDGSLDQSFGNQGVTKTAIGITSSASSMALQPDGKIVVAGNSYVDTTWQAGIIRLNNNGTLDSTFSHDGILLQRLDPFSCFISAIAIQPDGKIVATGYRFDPNDNNIHLNFTTRFLPNGLLDSSFANNGVLLDKFAGNPKHSNAYAIALQQDGKIIIGGYSNLSWPLSRYLPNGTLDPTFDFDGKVFTQIPQRIGWVNELAVQPDGKIIAVGTSKSSPYSDDSTLITIARYLPNGALDNSFGTGGIMVTPQLEDGYDDIPRGMALQSDGKIIVVGNTEKNYQYKVGIARYRTNLGVGIINNKSNVLCYGGNSGSATAEPFGGNTPYAYLWSNGQTTKTAMNLSAGTYTVTVTGSGGSGTVTATVTITQPPVLTVSAAVSGQMSCLQPAVTATASVSGGTPGYVIQWENGENGPIATFSAAGTYRVTVTDANGCSKTSSVTVANGNFTAPTAVVAPGGALTCLNNQLALNAGGSSQGGNYSYNWTTIDGQIVSGSNTLVPLVGHCGVYTLVVTDNNNGCTADASTTVTCDNDLPHIPAIQVDVLTCVNETVTLDGTSATPGVNYQWAGPNGYVSDVPGPVVAEPGNYVLVVTNPANSCTVSASVTVQQNTSTPTASIVAPENLNCHHSMVQLDAGGSSQGAAFTYWWATGDGSIQTGETSLTPTVITAGDYQLLVTNTENGCTSTASVTVIQHTPVEGSVVSSTNVSCHGGANGAGIVTASGGEGNYAYVWSNNTTDPVVSNLSAGVYTVTITDNEGCSGILSVSIAQPELLLANAGATGETSVGAGNGTATASPTGGTPGYTYFWSNGQSSATITDLAPGSYTVTVYDDNDCSTVQTVDVAEYDCTLSVSVIGEHIHCFGDHSGAASIVISGGQQPYTYLWSNGATASTINNLTAGNYAVTATDHAGCATVSSIELTQPQPLAAAVGAIQHVLCPDDLNGAATINTTGGTAPYQYSENLTNLSAGDYLVSVTDSNGCSTTVSFSIVATDHEAPVMVCPSSVVVCGAGIIAYNAPLTTDNCSGLITTTLVGGLPSGSYFEADSTVQTFLATDAIGNSTTCSFTIVVHPVPAVVLDAIADDHNGQGAGSIMVTGSGGTGNLHYSWTKDGQFFSDQEDLEGLTSGVYSLVVTDENGCSAERNSIQVLNTVGLDEPAISLNLFPNPSSGTIQLDISGATIITGSICNIQGKLVYLMQPSEWQGVMDISRLSNGIYYLRLQADSGHVFTLKFVKSE